jgi:hypothetical protein
MVTAGFEGDIRGRPARFLASGLQGVNFGMLRPGSHMPAFTDDLASVDDDTADARIGCRGVQAALGKAKRKRHESVIRRAERRRHQRPSGCVGCGSSGETSRMTLENSSTSSKFRYTEAKRT